MTDKQIEPYKIGDRELAESQKKLDYDKIERLSITPEAKQELRDRLINLRRIYDNKLYPIYCEYAEVCKPIWNEYLDKREALIKEYEFAPKKSTYSLVEDFEIMKKCLDITEGLSSQAGCPETKEVSGKELK